MRNRMAALWAVGALLLGGCATTAPRAKPVVGQHPQALEKTVTKTVAIKYLLFLPQDYGKKDQQWPLILFLHGAGERGDNLDLVKKHGPPKIVDQKPDFPFVVISPQCPADSWWTEEGDALIALLDDILAHYRVDPDRVYLTGLSMGGFGTWDLAIAYPKRFAAIAPICGRGKPYMVKRIKDVPAWVFHGGKDPVVPIKDSEDMVNALKKVGAEVKFTVYPEAGHDSWTETYNNPALYDWFLAHRRPGAVKSK